MREDTFSTNDLNLSAVISVATGQTPVVIAIPGEPVLFNFRRDEELAETLFAYHHGLKLEARLLLQMRNRLFARVREARQ